MDVKTAGATVDSKRPDVHTEDRQTSIKKPRRHDTPSFGVQQGDLRMGQPPNAHQYTECGLFNLSEPCDAVRATSRANQESQAITRLMHASSEGRHEPPRKTRRLHERNFSDSAKSRLKEVETTELFVSTSSASSSNPLQPQRDVIPKANAPLHAAVETFERLCNSRGNKVAAKSAPLALPPPKRAKPSPIVASNEAAVARLLMKRGGQA